jgi:hypothetical protein
MKQVANSWRLSGPANLLRMYISRQMWSARVGGILPQERFCLPTYTLRLRSLVGRLWAPSLTTNLEIAIVLIGVVFSYASRYLGGNRFLGATSTRRRLQGWRELIGRLRSLPWRSPMTPQCMFHGGERMACCPRNHTFRFLEGKVMQSPPSSPQSFQPNSHSNCSRVGMTQNALTQVA